MIAPDPRTVLARAAAARGLSLAALSAAIRRNPAYLQQFVARGSPRRLAERDRRVLAAMLGVEEAALGGDPAGEAAVALPRLDVEASAGPGAEVTGEAVLYHVGIDAGLARTLGLNAGRAAVIGVRGTSMVPTLADGDQLVVDTADRQPGRSPRVYVVRIDGALMVKRVSRAQRGRLVVRSDNPEAGPVPAGEVEVVGRAVWRLGAAL